MRRSMAAGVCALLLAIVSHATGLAGDRHPAAPGRAGGTRGDACSDPAAIASSMWTRKLSADAIADSVEYRHGATGAQLAFLAAIEIGGPCADLIDGADLTTLHLSTGAIVSLDAGDKVVVHPGDYFPPVDRAVAPHPAIGGSGFVMAVPVREHQAGVATDYVGIWNRAGSSWLYEYTGKADGAHVLGHALLVSAFPLRSVSVLPDVDTPARMLYLLQGVPQAPRLLIYRWTSDRR